VRLLVQSNSQLKTISVAQPVQGFSFRTIQAACAVGQATLFLVIYSGCLFLSGQRHDVGQLYSSWELRLPLVPPMILPYFSIYPLFLISFFFCTDTRSLRAHTLRLCLCQLVAGVCYQLFPLRCGFDRPAVDGPFGMLFQLLEATDRPYNLAPSLHVATAIIVGVVMATRLRGLVRMLAVAWFILIALSTVFTWQHHVVDVLAGGLLGVACVRSFAGGDEAESVNRSQLASGSRFAA
jgi:membrane-associated phospholipid phosphatase